MINTLLLICFGLSTVYGFFWNVRNIRKIRAPRKYKNAILAWAQRPHSRLQYELNSWIATSIHWAAIITLGLVVFLMLVLHPLTEIAIPGLTKPTAAVLAMPILGASVAGIGFIWGQSLFGPIAEFMGGDSHVALDAEGMLYAGQLFPWSTFSHFSFDVEQTVVQIWSASFPGVVGFVLLPPSPEYMSKLVGILQIHLPTAASPSFFMKCAFPAFMAGISILFVAFAFLMLSLPIAIALIVNSLLIYAPIFFGGKLIMRFVFGGKAQPAPVE